MGIPEIWGWSRMARARSSVAMMNKVPEIGSPCFTPELKGMGGDRVLLIRRRVDECARREDTIWTVVGGNLKKRRAFLMKMCCIESNALAKSKKRKMELGVLDVTAR